jgi:isoquinoline 1-oxidoreductase
MIATDLVNMHEHEVERYELAEPLAYVFRVNRRQFMGGLGAGLVFALTPSGAFGQRRSNPAAADLESRLHIGEDGRITVLNGKIEEGQGARTEIAMAAAEELDVPLASVDVRMADTAETPSDGITAGSRTTPSTVPAVRQAAAAARELL